MTALPRILAALIALAVPPAHAEDFAAIVAQPIAVRCLVVGDSNVVLPAAQLVAMGQFDGEGPAIALDFAATIPGSGLRDLDAFSLRLTDPSITGAPYDCVLVNLGANDALQGLPEGPYSAAVGELLALIPDVPIYWVGVPSSELLHPWVVAWINIGIACHDTPSPAFCPGVVEDPRLRYLDADTILGAVEPRFVDEIHYAPEAAEVLFGAVRDAVLGGAP